MAGIYDERILGAQQQKEFARRLRDQAAEPAGQMVSGWYVPNTGGAVVSALRNMMGAYQENKANEELKGIEREKAQATIQALNKAGIEAPESYALQAGTPAQQPGFIDKAVSFLRGNEQPQATPAIPYQQNVAQNVNPDQMKKAMLEYQLLNGGDINKISGLGGNQFKPTYFTGPNGVVHAIDATSPLSAAPVMVNGKPFVNVLYNPEEQYKLTKGKEKAKLHEVTTPSGATTWMTGGEITGGDDNNSLHIGDIVGNHVYLGGNVNEPSSWRER